MQRLNAFLPRPYNPVDFFIESEEIKQFKLDYVNVKIEHFLAPPTQLC